MSETRGSFTVNAAYLNRFATVDDARVDLEASLKSMAEGDLINLDRPPASNPQARYLASELLPYISAKAVERGFFVRATDRDYADRIVANMGGSVTGSYERGFRYEKK